MFVCLFVFLFFQALKVEEKTFSYQAELEILDSTICKANAMEVTFQPVKCPTQVHVGFKGARRYRSARSSSTKITRDLKDVRAQKFPHTDFFLKL